MGNGWPSRRIQSRETLRPWCRQEQLLVLDPEAGGDRPGMPGRVGGRHLGVIEAGRKGRGRADQDLAGSEFGRTVERYLAGEHVLTGVVTHADERPSGSALVRVWHGPGKNHTQDRRLSRRYRSPHGPRHELDRTLEGAPHGFPDHGGGKPCVCGGQHPARPRLRRAEAVDLEQRAKPRRSFCVEHVHQRPQHAVARAGGAVLALHVLPPRQTHGQGPGPRDFGPAALPSRLRHAHRPRGTRPEGARLQGVHGPDQELVGERGLAQERDVAGRAPGLGAHRLVERGPSEHHQSPAAPDEAADRGPGLDRKRASVREDQDVELAEAQALREVAGGSQGRHGKVPERLVQSLPVDGGCIHRGEAGGPEYRGPWGPLRVAAIGCGSAFFAESGFHQ